MKKLNLFKNLFQALLLMFICLWLFTVEVGTVATGSMIPNIDIGESVLYWKLYPINAIEKGDILVYHGGFEFPIVHRVKAIRYSIEDGQTVRKLQMKGDNNLSIDNTLVDDSNYIGKVFYIIKSDKMNTFIKAVANMNVLTRVGIALIILTIYIIVNHRSDYKRMCNTQDNELPTEEFKGGITDIKENKTDEQSSNND